MTEEHQIRKQPYYFMAIFGGKYADEAPIEDGHYALSKKFWPSEYVPYVRVEKGDIVLLYCTKSYWQCPEEMPGIGVVYCVEEGSEKNTMRYRYLPLTSPIDKSTISGKLSPTDLDKFMNLHSPFRRFFVIERESARAVLEGQPIDWP